MSSPAIHNHPHVHAVAPRTSWEKALSLGALAMAAGVALLSHSTGHQSEYVAPLIWILTLAAIATSFAHRSTNLASLLMASATCAVVVPIAHHRIGDPNPDGAIQLLGAAAATLAFARAFPNWDAASRFRRDQAPRTILWTASAGFALAASLRDDPAFTALALLAVGAAMCSELLLPTNSPSSQIFEQLVDSAALAGLAALVAAMLFVAAAVAGSPFGWPLAGVATVGFAGLVCILLDDRQASLQERFQLRTIAADSRLDALTGIANRRGFDERLTTELARAVRYRHPLSLLMLDVDDFKRINDEWGHPAGDRALASIAEIVHQSVRSIDVAARYGGEEFAILLPETASGGAFVVAERIRAEVEATTENPALTVSIGVATLLPDDSESAALIERADAALYAAKRAGKNRIELAD